MGISSRFLYKSLNGVFCIYKPEFRVMFSIVDQIKTTLAKELNEMTLTPVKERVEFHTENIGTDLPVVTSVPDLRYSEFAMGPHFQPDDFQITPLDNLSQKSTGVTLCAIGHVGESFRRKILTAKLMRVYRVKGEFGKVTNDNTATGRTRRLYTYHHMTRHKLDKVLAGIVGLQQKAQFRLKGVDLQAQEAYDIASRGMVRPDSYESGPVLYGLKCIEYEPPFFTLEFHTINESSGYLMEILSHIGAISKCGAVCHHIRRLRYGEFTPEDALIHKHWTVNDIVQNIRRLQPTVNNVRELLAKRNIERTEDPRKYIDDQHHGNTERPANPLKYIDG